MTTTELIHNNDDYFDDNKGWPWAVEFRAERFEETNVHAVSRLWAVWGRGCSVQASEEGQKRGWG